MYRILLCDDEPHILRAAEFKLSRSGFEVLLACDGEEAWSMMQTVRPDLLVTDCQMPRLDGIGLAERMGANAQLSSIPVIMLTAKGFELSADELRSRYGIHAVIAKPFSPKNLAIQAAEVIALSQAEAAASSN
ncbi:response regulator [Lignipirellula cremea]|uniref:Alkaline phosphatase synthesis transcriptional regulatory protein PhoP n=1 Tax=Lignipirellula cremea TaxID=2528010 RepID=A0A518DWT3_9BACT|nr:response regulator [Lignipirellula cremea]QDU96293.1 Alkaline phosphatase synthesis transcriptional regulatory protein PhoP [Lignipirellula cremea]